MLGSMKKCSNCHGTDFRRIKINRTVQCENCNLILEERCTNDLMEFHTVTQTEEVYCAVTPDFLHSHLVDDIPNDPYCTPGFISAFRMLSPLGEPVYAASSRTLNGALAEMERLIGDALFAGYVGYNGRAPGGTAVKKEEPTDSSDRYKSGGDARHTLVAYFEIVELASILCVDKETSNLAIRIFRHTASNTSLRNRNVESLATAAFVAAADRRWHEYQQWVKDQEDRPKQEPHALDPDAKSAASVSKKSPWPVQPRQLSVEEISAAANLDTSEVLRYLKVVNAALRKQRTENNSSVAEHIPSFCRRLELPEQTERLAIAIAENAMQKHICSRRNPSSVAAAAIYLACQLDGVRKTQTEICRATPLTEVTLRKVRNELNAERDALLPDWFKTDEKGSGVSSPLAAPVLPIHEGISRETPSNTNDNGTNATAAQQDSGNAPRGFSSALPPPTLIPPPLPPGFGERQNKGPDGQKVASDPPEATVSASQVGQQPNAINPLLAMMNNPAMPTFSNPMPMMPQFMMPPPPPPLPPPMGTANAKEREPRSDNGPLIVDAENKSQTKSVGESVDASERKDQSTGIAQKPSADMMAGMQSMMGMMQAMQAFQGIPKQPTQNANGENANASERKDQSTGIVQQPSAEMMAGMQSMMGMMQAVQAFQAMQQSTQNAGGSSTAQNPWAMMANAFAQAQSGPTGAGTPSNTDLDISNPPGGVKQEKNPTTPAPINAVNEDAKERPEKSNDET